MDSYACKFPNFIIRLGFCLLMLQFLHTQNCLLMNIQNDWNRSIVSNEDYHGYSHPCFFFFTWCLSQIQMGSQVNNGEGRFKAKMEHYLYSGERTGMAIIGVPIIDANFHSTWGEQSSPFDRRSSEPNCFSEEP
ncbi:hypothetical protein L1987_57700 [Smallanthus sonchifolius]|uniref:Uncharacterized protein n=1 Tax=Smallanthus sonchifolius TaxID=185202 RepID=A0ACB9DDC2_9ASTR|nr:hypothetical protein L1987_57700 [Smallanthus sonchifolius]